MLRKDKKLVFLVSAVLFVSLILFLISIYLNQAAVLEKRVLPVTLIVSNGGGFDLNSTALTLGTVPPGSNSSRAFFIENTYPFQIVAKLSVDGKIEKYLTFERRVIIGPGENKKISIDAVVPLGEQYGEYSGTLNIVLKNYSEQKLE